MPEITVDLTKIKRYPLAVTIGSTAIGPHKEAPTFEPDQKFYECMVYDNGGNKAVAKYLTQNHETITLNTLDIDAALDMVKTAKEGDNIYAVANKKVITFTPVVPSGVTAKTLVFPNCYLEPSLSYVPSMGGNDHTAKLVFKAMPDATTDLLYTWGSAS